MENMLEQESRGIDANWLILRSMKDCAHYAFAGGKNAQFFSVGRKDPGKWASTKQEEGMENTLDVKSRRIDVNSLILSLARMASFAHKLDDAPSRLTIKFFTNPYVLYLIR